MTSLKKRKKENWLKSLIHVTHHNPVAMRIIVTTILLSLFAAAFAQDIRVAHYTETTGYNHGTKSVSYAMFSGFNYPGFNLIVDDYPNSNWMDTLENIQYYDVVVWSNTSGNNGLTATQRANFEQYINGGGGYLGIHAATDTYRHSTANGGKTGTWDWYAENLPGASVQENPNHTSSNHNNDMTVLVPGHPTMANVPQPIWNKTEEYYYWQNGYLATGYVDLLQVAQTGSKSYDIPRMMARCKEHPNGARVFYTALGHSKSNFTSDQNFQNLIKDALFWVANPTSFPIENIDGTFVSGQVCWDALGEGVEEIHIQHYAGGEWVTDTIFTEMSGCYIPDLCGIQDVRVYSSGSWGEVAWSATLDFEGSSRLEQGRILLSCDIPEEATYEVYSVNGTLVHQSKVNKHGEDTFIPFLDRKGTFIYRIFNDTWTIEQN